MTAIYNEFRPRLFKHVVGQAAVVAVLREALAGHTTQSFLLSGPSGVGKTTLARIAASKLGCQLTEIDGATYTGVDKMREIVSSVQYLPFGQHQGHAVIIDECHRVSAQGWDSLLKAIEEPPPGVYWFFCTTNPGKLPTTVQTRTLRLTLKPLGRDDLTALVDAIAKRAAIQLPPQVNQLIVAEAAGSARQALVNLDACRGARDRVDAAARLRSLQESDVGLQLCRTLAGYANREMAWPSAMQLLDTLLDAGEDPEGIRIRICHYFTKAIRGATEPKKAAALLQRMEPFAYGYTGTDAEPLLVRAIGAALLIS